MKSIVLTLTDIGSYARLSITDGVVHQIISGGIPAADVLRKGGANLVGTPEEIRTEVERVFNLNGCDYVAALVPTRRATIYSAGNGLPGFGDVVLAEDELWQIVTPDSDLKISTNGGGQANSIKATLVAVAGQCDLTDEEWDAVYDGSVVLD